MNSLENQVYELKDQLTFLFVPLHKILKSLMDKTFCIFLKIN